MNSILIIKAKNKENTTVILNVDDKNKMNDILSDQNTYTNVNKNPINKIMTEILTK